MPNCDFYACGDDHRAILEFLLDRAECDIYELASEYDSPLKQFRSLRDFEEHFGFSDWNDPGRKLTIYLQLFPHDCGGAVNIEKISLNPKSCNGATFRYNCEGWGMVQLYLELPRDGRLRNSHTNHNSEARAMAWAPTIPGMGNPADWDWKKVTSFSSRLNRSIRKLAVDRDYSRPILARAAAIREAGVRFQ